MTDRASPLQFVTDKGGRVDWSKHLDQIVFDARGDDNLYDVYVMNPDGSVRRSLTSGVAALPQKQNGNPAWHPSGDFIVFQAEKADNPGNSLRASPGAGIGCDLWLMDREGTQFFPLTNLPADGVSGALHPHFSDDGRMLLWTEHVRNPEGEPNEADIIGEWRIQLADFDWDGDTPRLTNVRSYQPGEQRLWYETHQVLPDGKTILFCGNLESGQPVTGMDIYTFDTETSEVRNLTQSPETWDEHAHLSPRGDKIVWMSNRGFGQEGTPFRGFLNWLATELWVMNPDGSDKRRLTHLNEPTHPHYQGARAVVADLDFNADGSHVAAIVNLMTSRGHEEYVMIASVV